MRSCSSGARPLVGRVARTRSDVDVGGAPLLGEIAVLPVLLEQHELERVIITPGSTQVGDSTLTTIRLVRPLGVKVSVLPRLLEAVGSSVRLDELVELR
jgi:hypothetical protein